MATTTATSNEKQEQTIADYVGDMAALEAHIEEALDRQLTQLQDDPAALSAVQGFHDTVKQHRDTLRALQEETGATAGNPIKDAGAALLGKAAGVIDLVRTEGNSKALRDDYAAFSLAAISYAMLYTTAKGLGDPRVASLAERFLTDYATNITRINELMPAVVARELEKDEHRVENSAVEATRAMVTRAWEASERVH
jgi:ferritin-like metal-binding protein YciE